MSSQSALTLRYAAPKDLREDDGVVVMSDTDRARHEADERLDTILGQLVPSGASVVGGAVGDDTPMTAVQDHVRAFAPDQILLAHRSRNMPTGRKEGSSSGSRARPDPRSGFRDRFAGARSITLRQACSGVSFRMRRFPLLSANAPMHR